jgi:hypothetical protein
MAHSGGILDLVSFIGSGFRVLGSTWNPEPEPCTLNHEPTKSTFLDFAISDNVP